MTKPINENESFAFEDHFARVTSPLPTIKRGLTPEMASCLVDMTNISHTETFVLRMAQSNDVDSLKVLLDSGELKTLFKPGGEHATITYAVAHMLVDGSGNDVFAREWMESFGHTRLLATKTFNDLWESGEEGRWHEQQRLGVAVMANILQIEASEGPPVTPMETVWRNQEGNEPAQAQQAREFAFLLRVAHPEGIPLMEVRDGRLGRFVSKPVTDTLFAHDDMKYRHLLPAIAMAYGTEDEGVRTTMRASIDVMLKSRKLSIEPREEESFQWNAMQIWGDETLGKRIWQSVVAPGRSFIESVIRLNSPLTYTRLEQAEAMGADIQDICDPMGLGGENKPMRLMDLAVQMRDPHMVGYLLARGCNPELKAVAFDGTNLKTFSAASIALALDPESPEEMAPNETKRIQDLMRMHLAKKAALSAISDLAEPVQAPGVRP